MVKVDKLHRVTATIRENLVSRSQVFLVFLSFILISAQSQAEFGSIVDIGLAGDLYLSNESANNGQGFVNLLMQNTWSESQLWIDVGAGGLVGDTATSYVKAPQIFYRTGDKDKWRMTLGRSRHEWSSLDSFWNMGFTQPIFKWNAAQPEQQGLTGLYVEFPLVKKHLYATAFVSHIFLPTQGPSYELSDGSLTSSNPWFSEPVEILDLGGQKAALNFDAAIPKTGEVLFKDRLSLGAQVSTSMNRKGMLFNAFFINKPKNDLILPFEGVLNLTTFTGDITIRPRVARHSVGGIDVGWQFSHFKTLFSWVHESKIDYDAPTNTTYPIIPKQNIFSIQQLVRLSRSQRLKFGYIKVNRNKNKIAGVFSSSQISTYLNRNRFEEALRLRWEGLLFKSLNQYKVKAAFGYTQSLIRDNIWLSADLRWSIYRGIEVFNHCDFFGGSGKNLSNIDFMSTYQNNDRCLVGGHYAF